jgi:hypothetical protein
MSGAAMRGAFFSVFSSVGGLLIRHRKPPFRPLVVFSSASRICFSRGEALPHNGRIFCVFNGRLVFKSHKETQEIQN